MIKVAILGTENSHANQFASALAGKDGKKMFDDIQLIGVYGDKSWDEAVEGNKNIEKNSSCSYFADSPMDFIGKADAVMVTSRHGARHLEYAGEYIKRGIPCWIDKPICASVEDVKKLVALVKQYKVPVCGGSSLAFANEVLALRDYVKQSGDAIIGGHVTAPVHMVNNYGNFWFYSQHLIQMITTIFGIEMRSVWAEAGDRWVRALYRYDNFAVTAMFGANYTAAVYKSNTDTQSYTIDLSADYLTPELKEFHHMLITGKGVDNFREFTAPVFIIDATIRAFEQKKEIQIEIPEL